MTANLKPSVGPITRIVTFFIRPWWEMLCKFEPWNLDNKKCITGPMFLVGRLP